MDERKKFRDHHAEASEGFDFRHPRNLWYLIGTPPERKAFLDVDKEGRQAVIDGSFETIGDEPDFICMKCLRYTCPDSPVSNDQNTQKRANVYVAIRHDVRWLEACRQYQEECLGLDEFYQMELLLIDEYWNHPEINDPNFLFNSLKRF